jgi:hypothetical protein
MDLWCARRDRVLEIDKEPMRCFEVVAGKPPFVLDPGKNVGWIDERRGAQYGKAGKEMPSGKVAWRAWDG